MSNGARLWTVFLIRRAAGCPSSHEVISSRLCFTCLRKASFIGQQIAALSGRNSRWIGQNAVPRNTPATSRLSNHNALALGAPQDGAKRKRQKQDPARQPCREDLLRCPRSLKIRFNPEEHTTEFSGCEVSSRDRSSGFVRASARALRRSSPSAVHNPQPDRGRSCLG